MYSTTYSIFINSLHSSLTFISTVVEDIESFLGCWTFLFVPKYQIYPVVKVVGYMLRLLQAYTNIQSKYIQNLQQTDSANEINCWTG